MFQGMTSWPAAWSLADSSRNARSIGGWTFTTPSSRMRPMTSGRDWISVKISLRQGRGAQRGSRFQGCALASCWVMYITEERSRVMGPTEDGTCS